MKNVTVMCVAMVFAMILTCGGPAAAAERLVPGQYTTIQAAINAAVTGDEVVIAPGTYTGAGNHDIYYSGKAITVRGANPGDPAVVAATIIDLAQGAYRGFLFTNAEGPESILAGLTIKNGGYGVSGSSFYGLQVKCDNASPTIRKCVLMNAGTSGYSGSFAVGLTNSQARFLDCTISGNNGAFYITGGSITIERCNISSNGYQRYGTSYPILGGAMHSAGGTVILRDCYINTNSCNYYTGETPCGISVAGGSVTLQGCTMKRNSQLNVTSSGQLNVAGTIMLPTGNFNKIRLTTASSANIAYSALANGSSSVVADAGCTVTWGAGNITPVAPFGIDATWHIKPGGVFMNAGDPNYVPAADEVDIDGERRIAGGRIDIGCDEAATVIVTSPIADEVLASGSQRLIKWTSGSLTVDLYFSTDGGAEWQPVAAAVPGIGSYLWTVPLADSNDCLVAADAADDGGTIRGLSSIFTINPYAPWYTVDPMWKSIGGDYDRKGRSASTGPQVGCVKDAIRTPGAVHTGVAIGWDGKLYIGCDDGTLLMYMATPEGYRSTSIALGSPITSSPSIGLDATVYVGCANGKLFALDRKGAVKWTFTTGETIVGSPAVAPDGKVFLASTDGLLYALGPDGSQLWQFGTAGTSSAFFASPTIGPDGSVYVADAYKPILYCLDPGTGAILWQVDFTLERSMTVAGVKVPIVLGRMMAAPTVGPDGTIYAMFEGYTKLYAIKPNGTRKWSKDMTDTTSGVFAAYDSNTPKRYLVGGFAWSEAVVGPDGTIYLSMDDPFVRAINPADGSFKWVARCGVAGGFTLTLGADGLIYACSDDKSMYILRPDGSIAGIFDGEGWLAYPVVGPDGNVCVSDSSGVVWVLSGDCPAGARRDLRRPADVGGLPTVDFVDFAVMAGDWAKSTWDYKNDLRSRTADIDRTVNYRRGDVDRDAYVDFADMASMAGMWLVEN